LPAVVYYVGYTPSHDDWFEKRIWSSGDTPKPADDVVADLDPQSFDITADMAVEINSLVINAPRGGIHFSDSFSASQVQVAAGDVSFLSTPTITDLRVSGGSASFSGADGGGDTALVNTLTMSGGSLASVALFDNPYYLRAGNGMTLSGGDKHLRDFVLQNSGAATWSAGNILCSNDCGVENLANATFTLGDQGDLVMEPNAAATYHFRNEGTLTVNPGGSRAFLTQDFTQTAGGTLKLELGHVAGTDYDRINAASLHLHGTLVVSLLAGAAIAAGDTFTILTGPRSGTFDSVKLPSLKNGLVLKIVYEANDVKLVAERPLPAKTPPVAPGGLVPTPIGTICPRPVPVTGPVAKGPPASPLSTKPVRYADGTLVLGTTDLESDGFGTPWGQTRFWTNNPGYLGQNFNGYGWVDTNLPYLIPSADGSQMAVIVSGSDAYTFDLVGGAYQSRFYLRERLTADAATALGGGVDGAVRRLETAYDGQGNAYLFTSSDAAFGGGVVNQVQRVFNGLGQLVTEYQSHDGEVSPSTTPKVQYAYSDPSGGANHSRLVSMTYPNGRVLNYTYGGANSLNDSISRLESLSSNSVTLETYSYLGLDTVVVRAHPQTGTDLTYVKQPGDPTGDAGDQYTGLDRFGRVVDQNWFNAGNDYPADEARYGYDPDGNRTYEYNLLNYPSSEVYTYDGLVVV
jgi:hypothetical protein